MSQDHLVRPVRDGFQFRRSNVCPEFARRHLLVCHEQLPAEPREVKALVLFSIIREPLLDHGLRAPGAGRYHGSRR